MTYIITLRELRKNAPTEYLQNVNQLPYYFTLDINKAQKFENRFEAEQARVRVYSYYKFVQYACEILELPLLTI